MSEAKIVITAQDNASKVIAGVRQSMTSAQESAQKLGTALGVIGGGLSLVGIAGVAGLGAIAKNAVDSVDAFNDLKDATGASIENISALDDVAARTGTSFETVQTALVKFNGVLKDAKPGSEAEKALEALGLSIKDLQALDPAQALLKTSQALAGFADDGNKARITQELFGKSLKEVAPFLKDLAEKGQLVAKVTTEQAEAAERFNKELFKLQKNSADTARALTIDLVTGINKAAQAFRESGLIEGFRTLFTGDDQYKNNVKLVQQTDELLALERSISELRNTGVSLDLAQVRKKEERLKVLREEIKVTQNYRKVLEDVAEKEPVKPSLPALTKGNKGKDLVDKEQKEKLTEAQRALSAYVKSLEGALQTTEKLNEEQKALDFLKSLGTTGDVAQVRELVLGQAKLVDGLKAQEDAQKAVNEARRTADTYIEGLRQEQQALADGNKQAQQHLEEIGLTSDALGALKLRRLDDAIATQEQAASQLTLQNSSEAEIEAMQRKIALLKEQRDITAKTQVAQASADTKAEQDRAAKDFASTLQNDLKGAFSAAFRDSSGQPLQAFGDAIANVIYSRAATSVAESLIGAAGGTGSGSILASLFGFPSFDGGGRTGSGPRAGGLDGKGGFMALLHPNETVLDHTKGQAAVQPITVVQNFTVGDVASISMLRQAVAGSERRIAAAMGRSMNYGGALA